MLCHATWAHIHLTKRKSAWRIEIKPYSLRLFCTHVIKKYQSFATTSQTFSILSVYKGGNTGYKGRLKTNFGLARFVGLSSRRKKTISIEAGDILGNLRARISDPWKKVSLEKFLRFYLCSKHPKMTIPVGGTFQKLTFYYQNFPFSWNCPFVFQKCLLFTYCAHLFPRMFFSSWLYLFFVLPKAAQRDNICLPRALFPPGTLYWPTNNAFSITLKPLHAV